MRSLIKKYKYYIFLIDEATKKTILRLVVSKIEIRLFLIYEIRKILLKDKRIVIVVRLNNAKKYEATKSKLRDIDIELKFIIIYIIY